MTDVLRHRGPDDSGTWADSAAGLAFGHRRLSIIDVSPAGHQPMLSECGRFVVTFNGEIYNYADLKDTLSAEGAAPTWRGHSDTEVLLACFAAWGVPETLRRANGMFALALWDRAEGRLYLARDRMGEKPLYYGRVQQQFAFASELKSLRTLPGFNGELDRNALALYMQFRAVPAPYSIYKGIRKLPPGCFLSMAWPNQNGEPEVQPYWSFVEAAGRAAQQPFTSEAEALANLESSLTTAIRVQSISDVPLGAFLSGGVDSSLIVALMQAQSTLPIQTFTVGFEETDFDESKHARAVAAHLGTDHHEVRVRSTDALAVIPLLPRIYDEPFADSSQIPTYLICNAARRKVTVALSGDGGDELFGGYNRYVWGSRLWRSMAHIPFPMRKMLGSAIAAVPPATWERVGSAVPGRRLGHQLGDKAHKVGRALKSVRSIDEFYRNLVTEWPAGTAVLGSIEALPTLLDDPALVACVTAAEHRMMMWDSLTYLPDDILTKVDRAAMAVSLETRVPFLAPGVLESAWRMPVSMKIRGGESKWALRQVLYKHVPKHLIDRPKVGFAMPIGQWLRGPLRDWAEDLLDERQLTEDGFLDPAAVRRAWTNHLSERVDETSRLWTVLMFQAWLREHA